MGLPSLYANIRQFTPSLSITVFLLLSSSLISFGNNLRDNLWEVSTDTTDIVCDLQTGSTIEFGEDISGSDCVELLANQYIDLVGDFNTVSGNTFDARIGNVVANTKVYAIPEYGTGVVEMDYTGKVVRTMLNLELVETENGIYKLKDLAYQTKLYSFDPTGDAKRYLIGFSNKYERVATSFSADQMRDGIDVTAYKGREITITAYMIDNFKEWVGSNAVQQTIFIPDVNYEATKKVNNITYYYAPDTRVYKPSHIPYYDSYGKRLNLSKGEIFSSLATTYKENLNPSWHKLNVSGIRSPEFDNSIRFLMDDFVKAINSNGVPHPVAYQVGPDGHLDVDAWIRWFDAAYAAHGYDLIVFRSGVLGAFASTYTNPFGSRYKTLFINNELWNFWESTGSKGQMFMNWVRSAYERHHQQTGNNILPWFRRIYNYTEDISDIGYANPDEVIAGTYRDLTFESGGDFEKFKNWGGKYGSMSASNALEWGANMNDFGRYVGNLYGYNYIYDIIYHGLLFQKHKIAKKPVFVIWHDVEPLTQQFRQSNKWVKFNDRVYRVPTKQVVGPEIMFATGAAVAFFTPPSSEGGLMVWSEAVWADAKDAEGLYPNLTAYELQSVGERRTVFDASRSMYPVKPVTFVNQAFDAFSIVKDHKEILENSEAIIADVRVDNNWFTDVEKYPYASAYNRRPFVAYREYKGELLVFAYAWYNHQNIETTFRTANGVEYTVEIKGCYPTIAKISN
jgi:hypothetical protein